MLFGQPKEGKGVCKSDREVGKDGQGGRLCLGSIRRSHKTNDNSFGRREKIRELIERREQIVKMKMAEKTGSFRRKMIG